MKTRRVERKTEYMIKRYELGSTQVKKKNICGAWRQEKAIKSQEGKREIEMRTAARGEELLTNSTTFGRVNESRVDGKRRWCAYELLHHSLRENLAKGLLSRTPTLLHISTL